MSRLAARCGVVGPFLGVLALAPHSRLAAQAVGAVTPVRVRVPCDGDTVTSVEVRSHAPSEANIATNASRKTRRVLGVPYEPTRPAVIAAYLRLAGGRLCSELARSESERLLRAQPFISSATVQALPDAPGRVRIQVDVVDELPLIVGGSISRGTVVDPARHAEPPWTWHLAGGEL